MKVESRLNSSLDVGVVVGERGKSRMTLWIADLGGFMDGSTLSRRREVMHSILGTTFLEGY